MNPFFPNQFIAFLLMFALWFIPGAVVAVVVLNLRDMAHPPEGDYQEKERLKKSDRKIIIGCGVAVGIIGAAVWFSKMPQN